MVRMRAIKKADEGGGRVFGMRNRIGMAVGAMVISAVFGCAFARGAGAISYSISYIENVATSMPENELSGLTGAGASTTTLSPTSPAWAGYSFLGWCDQATTKSGDTDTCASGHQFQPGGTITLDATANANNIKLYAMWKKVYTMQQFAAGTASTTCSAMSTGDTISLIDSRDEIEYLVGKLADGKCWMLDNLALDLLDSDVQAKMYSSTDNNHDTMTNASNATLKYLFAGGGTSSNKYATSKVITWPSSSISNSVPWIKMNYVDSPTTGDTYISGVDTTSWKYGGYYNYCAATAGSYCYGDGTSFGTSSGNATEDICPKGWRLPTGKSSGEYSALANAIYGSTGETSDATAYANYRSALRLPLSGYFYLGSAYDQGSYGGWWSSTRYDNNYMYSLYAYTSSIRPAVSIYRYLGYPVRCVLDTPVMQEQTTASLNTLLPNTGDSTTLKDSRDGQLYTVAKLADGKYWMVENLNLAGGTALDADKTDVTSAYISSFTTSNNLTKTGDTIVLPASSTSGFHSYNYSYVYNSNNKTTNCSDPGCYSYYSWDAATLGSGRTISTDSTDAPHSICPKGWRLPTSGNSSNNGWKRGDFYALATAYGANLESYYDENSATFYNNAGPGTIPGFLLAGYYYYGSFLDGGSSGSYWSATSYSSTSYARNLFFDSSYVDSANYNSRYYGFSVRCLFSGQ